VIVVDPRRSKQFNKERDDQRILMVLLYSVFCINLLQLLYYYSMVFGEKHVFVDEKVIRTFN